MDDCEDSGSEVLIVDSHEFSWLVTSLLFSEINIETDLAKNFSQAINMASGRLLQMDKDILKMDQSQLKNKMHRLIMVE